MAYYGIKTSRRTTNTAIYNNNIQLWSLTFEGKETEKILLLEYYYYFWRRAADWKGLEMKSWETWHCGRHKNCTNKVVWARTEDASRWLTKKALHWTPQRRKRRGKPRSSCREGIDEDHRLGKKHGGNRTSGDGRRKTV